VLVLTRRWGETVVIGEDVELTILSVVNNQVRFGVAAPRHIAVDREEVRLRKDTGLPQLSQTPKPAPAAVALKKVSTRPILRRRSIDTAALDG